MSGLSPLEIWWIIGSICMCLICAWHVWARYEAEEEESPGEPGLLDRSSSED